MSFIAPTLLAALPLVALPIIIHLINQRRFQTIRWGAMMFLLAANRLSRGYARLRQWLIMAFRMLAIAGLIFAIARPLASGWLGLTAGGRPDTTIVLLDRSPSMQETGPGGGSTKLETGRQRLVQALKMLGSSHWVLVDSTTNKAVEIESPDGLINSPASESASSASDLPAMLQAAHDYIQANKSGRTEIWICSDLRENDWDSESGRWQTLRESFREFPQGVRFHLLAYPQTTSENVAIRVTDVRRLQTSEAAELFLSLKLTRTPLLDSTSANSRGPDSKISIPIQFEIDGARSEMTIEMEGTQFELKDHRIPLERSHERGWGRVSIPADANLADNEFCFVFDRPVPRVAIILADDSQAARPLELAAAISPDPSVTTSAEIIGEEQLTTVEWEKVSLLVWQSPLPKGQTANIVKSFVERGGQALFLPPATPGPEQLFGVGWKKWVAEPEEITVDNFRGDQDLLANTQSGAALPVGQLQIRRYAELSTELSVEAFTPLASVRGGKPLLARATTPRGGAYFLATTPAPGDSSLATGGVVLYVLVQRALAAGAGVLSSTRQFVAGAQPEDDPATWQRITGDERAISTEFPFHRGVYAAGERLLAVNRPAAEDQAPVMADQRVSELFRGLDYSRVNDQAGSLGSLIQEIWRLFLAAMIVALIVEAGLCLPKLARARESLLKSEPEGFKA